VVVEDVGAAAANKVDVIIFTYAIMPTTFVPLGGSKGRTGIPYPQAPPILKMVIIKSNDWYYKTGSLPSTATGSCSRNILNAIKRRT
jgi:hypothetical protein